MNKLLPLLLTLSLLGGCSIFGNQRAVDEASAELTDPGAVIDPDLERRDIRVPRIDTEDFEIGVEVGSLNVEDFGGSSLVAARLAYHVSEDFFLEGSYGQSQVSDEAFRQVGLPIFPNQEEDLSHYGFTAGYNFLPGEVFLGKGRAFTSMMYLQAGVGNTDFIDEDRLTYQLGFGLKVLPADWLALRLDARDYMFESDLLGENKLTHNFAITFSISAFF